MKKIIHPITITILSVLLAISLQAQDTIRLIAPSGIIEEGVTEFDIPIRVSSFTNISGMQFTLRWDADVLEFSHVDTLNFGLDFMTNDNFGKTETNLGILTFFWEDHSLQGQDLPDDSMIFTVKTKVVGTPGAETMIEFSDSPTAIELSDPDFNVFPTDLVNGMITLEGTSSAVQRAVKNADFSVSPNPFTEKTTVGFSLKESSQTQISVYDLEGKKIYEANDWMSAGAQTVELDRMHFEAAGIYLLKVSTDEFKASEKLFLVR